MSWQMNLNLWILVGCPLASVIYCRMVTTSSYSFQVLISNYLLGFLFCSLFKLSHPNPNSKAALWLQMYILFWFKSQVRKPFCSWKECFLLILYPKVHALWWQVYIIFLFFSPGSGAYNIFHPLLFKKSLDVLRLWPCKDVLNSKLYCRDDSCQVQCII